MSKNKTILVKNFSISIIKLGKEDFIYFTDIARNKNAIEPKVVVKNWMRFWTTLSFLGFWKQLNNPDFKGIDFDSFPNQKGSNSIALLPSKWIKTATSRGPFSKSGCNIS